MMLHTALCPAALILELPASMLKSIIYSECKVGMPFISWRRPLHVDLTPIGKC